MTFSVFTYILFIQSGSVFFITAGLSGMNISEYKKIEESFRVQSPQTGLRLIMKINYTEYFGHDEFKRGSGFLFQIQGKNKIASFRLSPASYISPGYNYRVVLKPIHITRQTENLGRCSNFVYLGMVPNATVYHQEFCILQCAAEVILKNCQCVLTLLVPYKDYFVRKAKEYGIKSELEFCTKLDRVACMKEVESKVDRDGIHSITRGCTRCPSPCYEEEYDLQISATKLSKKPFDFASEIRMTNDEFRKSFLAVSFEFESDNFLSIIEIQSFTTKDLFIYIGGNIGLFLGMSFISPFEVVQFLIDIARYFYSKFSRRKKKTHIVVIKKSKTFTPATNHRNANSQTKAILTKFGLKILSVRERCKVTSGRKVLRFVNKHVP